MSPPLILVFDYCPDRRVCALVQQALLATGLAPEQVLSQALAPGAAEEAGPRLAASVRRHRPGLLLPCLPSGARGQAECLFQLARQEGWDQPVVVATEEDRGEELAALLHLGAADFVTDPFRPADLRARLARWRPLWQEPDPLSQPLKEALGVRLLVGHSPRFLEEVRKLPRLARCDASVLIQGETGTGKELCARAIHHLSRRCAQPFTPVNCGAIPPDLAENELFGHVAGAYTGASTTAGGLVQETHGGTLFLDEVDCLPLSTQVKLLRFLQEGEFRPVGSARTERADVRILAAANGPLDDAVRAGRFRRDLYYRLDVVSLVLPPLRERMEDIPELARHFLARFGAAHGKPLANFSAAALQRLLLHDWPGNVRELENIIERAVIFAEHGQVRSADLLLPGPAPGPATESFRSLKARAVRQFERGYLRELLRAHAGNITRAAKAAQKNRRALWELIRKHQLLSPADPAAATPPGRTNPAPRADNSVPAA